LNKNKTFAINCSLAKTPTHTLNIILDIQNFTLTESIKFGDVHLEQFIMETAHGKIIEETECSLIYDEELILLSDSRLIKDSLFHIFSVIVSIWDNFLGLNYKHT
jgi:hypothetical protein